MACQGAVEIVDVQNYYENIRHAILMEGYWTEPIMYIHFN